MTSEHLAMYLVVFLANVVVFMGLFDQEDH